MAEEGVKVVGMWASPFVARVEMALRLKGVTYEYLREDLANKSEMLLRYNPVTKKVPVLVHGGKPMAESAVIVEYIDEVWKDGYPIMPADPYERAQARFWARYADEKCNPAIYVVYTSAIGEGQAKLVHEAQECLKTLQKALEGKKFFGGDAVGYLDIVVGWYARWVPIIEELSATSIVTLGGFSTSVTDQELPMIKAWFDRILAIDVVRETLPPRDKLLPLCKPDSDWVNLGGFWSLVAVGWIVSVMACVGSSNAVWVTAMMTWAGVHGVVLDGGWGGRSRVSSLSLTTGEGGTPLDVRAATLVVGAVAHRRRPRLECCPVVAVARAA
ncbi:hypothetical protein QYE76_005788 [Lolium multiflorum]|uniref:glutathione transferase n=1 Tax=Lolium multiflorum TaxID=4521 RepID=A0AAD8W3H4_LOLMU|nr:hypothetical protein QYE76_005788 [Lolium multiflorum]